MQFVADRPEEPTAIRTDLGAIFVSMELSRSNWLIELWRKLGDDGLKKAAYRGG